MPMSSGHSTSASSSGYPSGVYVPTVNQGLPTLIVMMVVLTIILLFCFWGAPAVRAFCRRKICCCCPMDEPNLDNGSTVDGTATPTIILLPYGRMLVVDRTIFAQLQADHTGIDFMELSANLIRAQRIQAVDGSNPSILESEMTSKGLTPTSMDFLPPAYEEIFGTKTSDLPPSYSEISMMLKKMSNEDNRDYPTRATRVDLNGREEGTREKDLEKLFFDNKPILRTSTSVPEGRSEFACELQRACVEREFSSLETDMEQKCVENNKDVLLNNLRFNSNVTVHTNHNSGPKLMSNCGSNDPNPDEPSTNSVHTLNERRGNGNESKEYIDRESTV